MIGKKLSLLLLPLMLAGTLQANDPFGDDIFKEMYEMQKEMDKLFERMHQRAQERTQHFINTSPASFGGTSTLLEDKGGYYEYNTQIRENQDSQISVTIENGILRMKVSTDSSKKENQTQEHFVSMIQRSQSLPSDADASSLKSEFKNGFLVITLQKKHQEANTSVQPLPLPKTSNEPKNKNPSQENNNTKINVPHTSSHA